MRQHSVDLLPDSIRLCNQAGMRMGRWLMLMIGTSLLVVALVTHSRIQLQSSHEALVVAESQANQALAVEQRAQDLRSILQAGRDEIEHYQTLAFPLEISTVLSTLINRLPESVSLDRIDFDAGSRCRTRSIRSKGEVDSDETIPRVLTGEIAGFAASDLQIAELVAALESTPPFRDVSMDFSRTRAVRSKLAREFRLSFHIDLDVRYTISTVSSLRWVTGQEVEDVQ